MRHLYVSVSKDFASETESDFDETISLLQEVQYTGLFAFKYSPRPEYAVPLG